MPQKPSTLVLYFSAISVSATPELTSAMGPLKIAAKTSIQLLVAQETGVFRDRCTHAT